MISVVIPAYNEEKYIKACLDSLMQQDEKPDEIIVVDNNSTDRTSEIVNQYPVKLVTETEQGMIPARNRGFNEAKYDLIAQTDADAILPPDWIKRIKKHFAEDQKLIALSGPAKFYDIPEVGLATKWAPKAVFNSFYRVVIEILGHDCLYGPNKALRKSAWEQVKNEVCLDDSEVHEDIDLSIHLGPYGKIEYDTDLIIEVSFRRFKKLEPYFEYPYRIIKSIKKHKKLGIRKEGKQLVKKLVGKYL